MERLDEVLTRVLANCRVRMDKRKRKAGAGVEPSPGSLPRGTEGGTILAGEGRATLRGAPSSGNPRRAERRPTLEIYGPDPDQRLEPAE
jgi:hypothetical protein